MAPKSWLSPWCAGVIGVLGPLVGLPAVFSFLGLHPSVRAGRGGGCPLLPSCLLNSGALERDSEQHKHPDDLSFSQAEHRADGGGGPPAAALGQHSQTCLFTAAVLPLVHAICFCTLFPSVRMTRRMQRPGFLQLAIQEPGCAEQCNVEANCLQSCCPLLRRLHVIFL